MNKDEKKVPNPVDLYVGARIRMRRRSLGISQTELADDLGLTFQQVQKYERGANRVSASKLYEIARSLKTPVAFFFDGLDSEAFEALDHPANDEGIAIEFLTTNEGLELAAVFPKVKPSLRRIILSLVRGMIGDQQKKGAEDEDEDQEKGTGTHG